MKFDPYSFGLRLAYCSMLAGLMVGVAYHWGWLNDEGWWIVVLEGVAKFLLDKEVTIYEAELAALLALCGVGFGASWMVSFGRLTLFKCWIGLAVVPIFLLASSMFIPAFQPLVPACLMIVVGGYSIAYAVWYFFHDLVES